MTVTSERLVTKASLGFAVFAFAAFLASLQDYLRTYRFGVATTADIVAIWRAHSDAVTSELLLDWLELRTGTAGPRHPA